MRLSGLGAIAALGAMLTMPVLAQTTTTTTTPAAKPPVAGTVTTMPPPAATKPVTATTPAAKPVTAAPAATTTTTTTTTTKPVATTTTAPAVKPAATPLHLDINTASATELDKIKYVGAKRAAAIIAGRPWKSTDELVTRKVLPKAYYEKVKGNLFVQ